MNAIDQSSNRIPCHTDWRRYDSPTVLRRHGRGFLEWSWKPGKNRWWQQLAANYRQNAVKIDELKAQP